MARTAAPEVEWEAQQGQCWGKNTQANSEDGVGDGMHGSVGVVGGHQGTRLEGSGRGQRRWLCEAAADTRHRGQGIVVRLWRTNGGGMACGMRL